jgi:3-hydroxyisobutyrate dehydrogenase
MPNKQSKPTNPPKPIAQPSPNSQVLPVIGFIGLGVMGTPMAGHLAGKGYHLHVYDLSVAPGDKLASEFTQIRSERDLRALAYASDIVITMLPNGQVVQDVLLGKGKNGNDGNDGDDGGNGLINALRPGSLVLDTSSSEPWLTQQSGKALAERGIEMVDAPVSGAQWGAQAAELVFMLGGSLTNIARVQPLLDIMGRASFHLGPLGSGHAMKCINNTITSMTFMATIEGLVMGTKLGLDPKVMNAVLNESTGMSWITQNHIEQRITNRSFDDPFKLALMVKDIGIAMRLAQDMNLPMPLSGLGHHLWQSAMQQAEPQASVSELARWVERLTGVQIDSPHSQESVKTPAMR